MNTGTDIHRVLINARGICQAMPEFAPRHESLYSRGSHFSARFFACGEGRQTALRESTTEIWFPPRRDVKNDLASFHRIMRHQVRLIYCQGQGEERRGEIAATGRRQPRRQGKRGGNREVWWDKKQETKREIKRRTKRERRIIDGRRRLPEDYTSRRLQFTPFGKLDIHRPTPSPPLLSCCILPFVDRRRMKYALAWISNDAANRIKLAMNLPTRPKRRRKGRRERNRWSFEKEAMGLFAHSRDKGDLKGWRPTGTNQLRWMNNVSR